MYIAFLNVFFDELLERLLFILCEGVDLPWKSGWGILFEFYCVIP